MKKSIFNSSSAIEVSERGMTHVIILFLLLVFSGININAEIVTQTGEQKTNIRMDILEKLEKGQDLSSEEIRNSLKPSHEKDDLYADFELPEIPDLPEFYGHPEIFINPPHIYINTGHLEFDEEALRELQENLSRCLEEMKVEIESVIHSEEMKKFQKEMKEWGEEIRREVEKAVKDLKTEKEITLKIEGVKS